MILLVNGSGFYVYYIFQLRQIRTEMREALRSRPDSELEVMTLTQAAFEDALVEADEMKVNGKMYDIARVERDGVNVKIYCVHDEKEDSLFALLQEVIGKPLKDRANMPPVIVHFITLSFLVPGCELIFQNDGIPVVGSSAYRLPEIIFQNRIPTPPPEHNT